MRHLRFPHAATSIIAVVPASVFVRPGVGTGLGAGVSMASSGACPTLAT
jgi:hypothetical protein